MNLKFSCIFCQIFAATFGVLLEDTMWWEFKNAHAIMIFVLPFHGITSPFLANNKSFQFCPWHLSLCRPKLISSHHIFPLHQDQRPQILWGRQGRTKGCVGGGGSSWLAAIWHTF
jgi:hypothetical protein